MEKCSRVKCEKMNDSKVGNICLDCVEKDKVIHSKNSQVLGRMFSQIK